MQAAGGLQQGDPVAGGCQLLTQFCAFSFNTAVWNWIIPIAALLLAMRETRRYSAKLRSEAASFGQPAASS